MFIRSAIVLLLAAIPVSAESFWQKFTWETSDGIVLVGDYHASSRGGAKTWILLHGLGSSRGEWEKFSKKLAEQGQGIFIYDARGHGDSRGTRSGQKISYQDWRSSGPGTPWDFMAQDLASAVQVLIMHTKLTENQIAIGGASLGANIALHYASEHPKIPAILLLSPGLEYAGIQTPGAYMKYKGRPVLIAASSGDAYAFASVRQLSVLAPSAQQVVEQPSVGHGVQMLEESFTMKVLNWMRTLDGNWDRRST